MNWQTSRRETGLVEHLCAHGVGHPNHGSLLWLAEQRAGTAFTADDLSCDVYLAHGCDGCCSREDFPGTLELALRHAHGIIRERNEQIADLEERIAEAEE